MRSDYWIIKAELDNTYNTYRKTVMEHFHMSAVEVDVIMFLANNVWFDTAADIVRMKKLQKSHVSLAVKGLTEKGYLTGETDPADRKRIHLKITSGADDMVAFGHNMQMKFLQSVFEGFSENEITLFEDFCNRMVENVRAADKKGGNHNDR